jgi:hypothetical protein
MTQKCCYFIRNVPVGTALDLLKCGENDLLFGELGTSALGTIEAILSQSYRPMLDSFEQWGKVDDEQKNDFISEIGSFITNINDALNSFASGLELRAPDPKILRAVEVKASRTALPTEVNSMCHTLGHHEASSNIFPPSLFLVSPSYLLIIELSSSVK